MVIHLLQRHLNSGGPPDRKQKDEHLQTTLSRRGYRDWSMKKVTRQMSAPRQKKSASVQNKTTIDMLFCAGFIGNITRV